MEVLSDDLVRQLCQVFDLVRGESLAVVFLCAGNCLRNITIVEGSLLLSFLGFSFRSLSRGSDFSSNAHFYFKSNYIVDSYIIFKTHGLSLIHI